MEQKREMTSESKITLKSGDGEVFSVPEAVAMELGTVKSFFEDASTDFSSPSSSSSPSNHNKSEVVVPLPNVHSRTLTLILRYCHNRIRVEGEEGEEEGGEGEEEDAFLKELSNGDLREMLMAANYLHVKSLMDVLVSAAAHRIKNRSVEYVRRFFGIENDFTPEEEDRLRQDSPWAYEGLDSDDEDDHHHNHL